MNLIGDVWRSGRDFLFGYVGNIPWKKAVSPAGALTALLLFCSPSLEADFMLKIHGFVETPISSGKAHTVNIALDDDTLNLNIYSISKSISC